LSNEKNEVNIRTKSVQENMVSNIMVEFLFMTMIKGLALGFGIFYMYELDIEIKRIINVKDINDKQEDVLNEMLTVVIWCRVFNFATLVYQLIFYGIRLFIACKRKSNFFFLQEDHLKKKIKNDNVKRISVGNISLPETNEDNIMYEKLDK
jgi:hypothetical protein